MADITIGNGATVQASTAEGQLLSIFVLLQTWETDSALNPNSKDYVQGSFNLNTQTFNGTFSIPVQQSLNAQGQLVMDVPNYLTGVNFASGVGGTFKSSNPAAYLAEIIMYCQILENDSTKNPTGKNNINATFNTDNTLFLGSATLPFLLQSNSDGSQAIIANPYLVTA